MDTSRPRGPQGPGDEEQPEEPVLRARQDPTRPVMSSTLTSSPKVSTISNKAYLFFFMGAAVFAVLALVIIVQSHQTHTSTAGPVALASAPVVSGDVQNDDWYQKHPDSVDVETPAPQRHPQSNGTVSTVPGLAGHTPAMPPVDTVSPADLDRLTSGPSGSNGGTVPSVGGTNYQPAAPAQHFDPPDVQSQYARYVSPPSGSTVPGIGSPAAPAVAATKDPRNSDIEIAMNDDKSQDDASSTSATTTATGSPAPSTDGATAGVSTQKTNSDYLSNQVTDPRSPYELQAGTKIPGIISESIDSDMPGFVNAIVSQDVYDSILGKYLLIPKGSRLLGNYVGLSGPGQTRTAVVFTRLFFPGGTGKYLDLGGMSGADQQGNTGVGGDVDNHNGRLIMSALELSILQVGSTIAAGTNTSTLQEETPAQEAAQSVGSSIGQVGSRILQKEDLGPTLHVRIGTRFNVRVEKDIVFPGPTAATAN